MGLVYLVVTPPFQVSDEPNHFYRCYQISELQIIPERRDAHLGGDLPRALVSTVEETSDDVASNADKKVDPGVILDMLDYHPPKGDRPRYVHFPNSALYSPVPYIPQLIGVLFGKLLGLSPLLLMYLGRLSNLVAAVLMCAYAIKITPVFGRVLLLLALTPMFVYQAASLSPDAMTNGLSVLLLAVTLKYSFVPDAQLKRRGLILIATICVLLGLCKSVYFLLALLYFIIPHQKVGSRRKYVAIGISIVLLSALSSYLWMSSIRDLFMAYIPGGFTDLSQPREFILSNPFSFARMVATNLLKYWPYYIRSGIGQLGWGETKLPSAFLTLYAFVICAVALASGSKEILFSYRQKLLLGAVALCGTALIVIGQFFVWTEAGSLSIRPAQGRHFIPYAPLYLLLLYNTRYADRVSPLVLNKAILAFATSTLLLALWFIIRRFY
jgi:uncharacterized membrane protein